MRIEVEFIDKSTAREFRPEGLGMVIMGEEVPLYDFSIKVNGQAAILLTDVKLAEFRNPALERFRMLLDLAAKIEEECLLYGNILFKRTERGEIEVVDPTTYKLVIEEVPTDAGRDRQLLREAYESLERKWTCYGLPNEHDDKLRARLKEALG